MPGTNLGTGPDTMTDERGSLAAGVEHGDDEQPNQRRAPRRIPRILIGTAVLLVVALIAGIVAFNQRGRADDRQRVADQPAARGLVTGPPAAGDQRLATSLLLAVEGHRTDPSVETQGALLNALNEARNLPGFLPDAGRDLVAVETPFGSATPRPAPMGQSVMTLIPGTHDVVSTRGSGDQALYRVSSDLKEQAVLQLGFGPGYVGASADGTTVAVSGNTAGAEGENFTGFLAVIDVPTWSLRTTIKTDFRHGVGMPGVSPDGSRIALVSQGEAIVIYDAVSGRPLVTTPVPDLSLWSLAWAPDGRRFFTGGFDGIAVWDGETGRRLSDRTLKGGAGDLAFDPRTGTMAVLTLDDSGVWLLDGEGLTPMGERLPQGNTPLQDVTFLDADRVAAMGNDGSVRLWDRSSRRQIGPNLEGHNSQGETSIAATADGVLVTLGGDGRLVRWDLIPDHMADRACQLAGRNLTRAEWELHRSGQPYRATCSQWPAGT